MLMKRSHKLYLRYKFANEARHSFRITVSDSLYKAINYHGVDRNLTVYDAVED